MSFLQMLSLVALAIVSVASCASQAMVPAVGELNGEWTVQTTPYRSDLGCAVRGTLKITRGEHDDVQTCAIEVREVCEVYDADKFVVAHDICTVETDGDQIVLRVKTRKVLAGNPHYLKGGMHNLARYVLGLSPDGQTLSGRYFGDWDTSVRLNRQ
ncbi:MAG: hypothetical protein QM773_02845 [Hyphomonadaceae bacterium]